MHVVRNLCGVRQFKSAKRFQLKAPSLPQRCISADTFSVRNVLIYLHALIFLVYSSNPSCIYGSTFIHLGGTSSELIKEFRIFPVFVIYIYSIYFLNIHYLPVVYTLILRLHCCCHMGLLSDRLLNIC